MNHEHFSLVFCCARTQHHLLTAMDARLLELLAARRKQVDEDLQVESQTTELPADDERGQRELTPSSPSCLSREESSDDKSHTGSESEDDEPTAASDDLRRIRQNFEKLPPGAAPLFSYEDEDPIEAFLKSTKAHKPEPPAPAPQAPLSDGAPLPVPTVKFHRAPVLTDKDARPSPQSRMSPPSAAKPDIEATCSPAKTNSDAPGAYAKVKPHISGSHDSRTAETVSGNHKQAPSSSSARPNAAGGTATVQGATAALGEYFQCLCLVFVLESAPSCLVKVAWLSSSLSVCLCSSLKRSRGRKRP